MMNILIIDDNPMMRQMVVTGLNGKFDVREARNGVEGLDLIAQHLPDIIVCDVAMPEMNGVELLKRVRANPHTAGVPFLFLTAESSPNSRQASREHGADGYLVKPFAMRELLRAVDKILHSRQAGVGD
jgi:DNA-binding response OmpR family regulator